MSVDEDCWCAVTQLCDLNLLDASGQKCFVFGVVLQQIAISFLNIFGLLLCDFLVRRCLTGIVSMPPIVDQCHQPSNTDFCMKYFLQTLSVSVQMLTT